MAGPCRVGARGRSLVVYWDVDAPATLEQARAEPGWYFHRLVPRYDAVLTYGGGESVPQAYRQLGARAVLPVYNAMDLEEYAPVPPDEELRCDLLFLGNRMPDREERFWAFFAEAAQQAPEKRFILGGGGWGEKRTTAPQRALYRPRAHVPACCGQLQRHLRVEPQPGSYGRLWLLTTHTHLRSNGLRVLHHHRCLGRHRAVLRSRP